MMKMSLALAAALLTVCASPSVADAAQRAAQRDWTRTVTRTPAGAFVLGNPKAKVRLIEYLSMTCGHCAHFSAEAWGPLKANYIRTGAVSLEVRHAIRDGFDLTASVLVRCGGPAAYFGATEMVLARQGEWGERAAAYPSDGTEEQPLDQRMAAMAKAAGLDKLFEQRGMTAARMMRCFGDPAEQKMLRAMTEEAWRERSIPGTPAFLINGALQQDIASWDALEPKIKAALK